MGWSHVARRGAKVRQCAPNGASSVGPGLTFVESPHRHERGVVTPPGQQQLPPWDGPASVKLQRVYEPHSHDFRCCFHATGESGKGLALFPRLSRALSTTTNEVHAWQADTTPPPPPAPCPLQHLTTGCRPRGPSPGWRRRRRMQRSRPRTPPCRSASSGCRPAPPPRPQAPCGGNDGPAAPE